MSTPSRQDLENLSDRSRELLHLAAEAWCRVFGPWARVYWFTARDDMPMRAVQHSYNLQQVMERRPRVKWDEHLAAMNTEGVAAPPPPLPAWTESILHASPRSAHEAAYLLARGYVATIEALYPPHRWQDHIQHVLRYADEGVLRLSEAERSELKSHIWWNAGKDVDRWRGRCQELGITAELDTEPILSRMGRELEAAIATTRTATRWGLEGQRLHVGERYVDLTPMQARLMAELLANGGQVALGGVMRKQKGAVWGETAPGPGSPGRAGKMAKVNTMLRQLRNRFADTRINLRVHLRGDQIILDGDRELLQRLCT